MKQQFMSYGIELTDRQVSQFCQYYDLLFRWNEKINLTAITEYDLVVRKHFIDSALLIKCDVFAGGQECRILDMGTGAGFPGIVLAILCPEDSFVLMDSLQKRIEFLKTVVTELGLSNVEVVHGRAEDFGRNPEYRNQFDFVVSRAVAELPLLLEYCIPFVKKDGYFISYKGPKYREEIGNAENALKELDAKMEKIEEFDVSEKKRYLLFVKKMEETRDKYPRRAGIPKKRPL